MPRLLQINITANRGSTGRIAEEIGLMVQRNRWESYIAYGRGENPSKSHLIRIGNDLAIYEHAIETRLFDRQGLSSHWATKRFLRKAECIKPDIIHLHNIHGYYINYVALFNWLSHNDIPVVWTLHDCWPFTGHCSHFDFVGCDRWRSECDDCPQLREYPSSFGFDGSHRNYVLKKSIFTSLKENNVTIIPVSEWLEHAVQQSFLSSYRTRVIHNGIDLDLFRPRSTTETVRKYGLFGSKYVIAVASTWTMKKGFNDYLELRKSLSENIVIVLVGVSVKQQKCLPPGMVGICHTDDIEELSELYTNASVVLNLSYEESFGMTTVEGLGCGTPSIVYNSTASPELVDNSTGIVIEPGNIAGVADAIMAIIEKRSEMRLACRNRAEKLYDKNKCYQSYYALYESIIKFPH